MNSSRRFAMVLLSIAALASAGGCTLLGSGTLGYVPASQDEEPSSVLGSPASVYVFRHEPGDAWPTPGKVGILVTAENVPYTAPSRTLVLLRLAAPGRPGDPRAGIVHTCEELDVSGGIIMYQTSPLGVLGVVPVRDDGSIRATLAVDEQLLDRLPRETPWALADTYRAPDPEINVLAIRCGTLTWEGSE